MAPPPARRRPRRRSTSSSEAWTARSTRLRLEDGDVRGVRALGARLGVVGAPGARGQGLEPRAVDAGVVDEQVLAAVLRRDQAEALLVAEPLHGSGGHCVTSAGHVNCDRGVLPMATPAALNTSFAGPSMGLA